MPPKKEESKKQDKEVSKQEIKKKKTLKEWISFIVLHPTLLIAILPFLGASFPFLYNFSVATLSGQSISQYNESIRYAELTKKNIICFRTNKPVTFTTENKKIIKFLTCPKTGDMHFDIYYPDPNIPPVFRWIEIAKNGRSASVFTITAELHATPNEKYTSNKIKLPKMPWAPKEICRQYVNGHQIRIIQYKWLGICKKFVWNSSGKLILEKICSCFAEECDNIE